MGEAGVEPTAFPFWENIGTVGMGTGLYLGDGWVLTSTHVGCLPFVLSDGSVYRPIAGTWQPLKNADGSKSDVAVFQVNQGVSDSALRKLSGISISTDTVEAQTPVLLVGTGYVEKKSAGEQNPVRFGAYQRTTREKRWALATTNEVTAPAATQGGLKTHCFATTFRAQAFGGQAAEGDSGGAAFVFDADERQWKLAGCIFAVSQVNAFVPYGARTYVGDLAVYSSQIDELACCSGH
ncbi:trypsin-like serine protease [Roseimicrobium sp. ORNL1]|uniref:trypsin-like serine protease n=1 Tax=Roseimicrobium sp. ORNL1 TaxID=2711231 RepID=UPI0013E14FA2|nr:trypsin-like serine protease [Roseimicrobium sp. ORNL1]QIF02300.1 S1 family peptidase [Roseimicrobium sp. ORNL1]